MGRAPCCEKMGLKRGPWTPEEDQLLIAYIQQHGHGNWRALPKFAGLLRCGKSCRLRWTNYLRPDIKRGNFTKEEEDTIINLHQALGNRWSTIAARLPGRTDNEIKNVWHTHLKKKLKSTDHLLTPDTTKPTPLIKCEEANMVRESKPKSKSKLKPKPKGESKAEYKNLFTPQKIENPYYAAPLSPQPSSSDMSSGMESATTDENHKISVKDENHDSWESLPQTDENLWSDVLPMEHFSSIMEELSAISTEADLRFPVSSITSQSSSMDDGIEFWYDLFANSEKLPDLPEF